MLEDKLYESDYYMVTQNVNYYFKKKNSIVYEKNFNGSKTHRFLYRIE